MHRIYVFSGLGVDRRVFDAIDFRGLTVEFIPWIKPIQGESLGEYAVRMLTFIPAENPILIGLSFGGMLAIEIAKIKRTHKVILIASVENEKQLPLVYGFIGKFNLHKLIPTKLLKKSTFISHWFFGIDQPSDKKLLHQILKDTDGAFLVWAIDAILKWKTKSNVKNVIRIHGKADRIIPLRKTKVAYLVEGGGHFMTVTHAKEVEAAIHQAISV